MDAISRMHEGFARAEDELFKQYFIILVEGEAVAPFVLPSMTYESIQKVASPELP
jgi:hypothetical protein